MRLTLTLHPDCRCAAVTRIEVEVARAGGALTLHYVISGKIDDLRVPPQTAPARADGLWRHTCFEAFVRAPPGAAYAEFNLAPSTQWAAYRFDGYRSGMTAVEIDAPGMELRRVVDCLELRVSLNAGQLPDLPRHAPWRLGLSAVIEETDGNTSYWALAHPPGKPDFHHAAGFAYDLAAAKQT